MFGRNPGLTRLSIIGTCRQQGPNIFAYMTNALTSHFSGQLPPSLLPGV